MLAQLSEQDTFPALVIRQRVKFERLLKTRSDHVIGYVRVANLSPRKRVFVRYTRNNWETTLEVEGHWVETVEGITDKFIFLLPFPTDWSGTIKFAICYELSDCQHWDDNQGENYEVWVTKEPSYLYFTCLFLYCFVTFCNSILFYVVLACLFTFVFFYCVFV